MNSRSTRYYLHIDADAFFASVEQSLHPYLKGKPTVTGRGASIVLALSYEAKALGIERGLPTHILKNDYPEVYMVESDYHSYQIFSQRMYNIISSYIPKTTQMSIDECSAVFPASYNYTEVETTSREIKRILELKLGCSFSIGIGHTPLIAKIASDMDKPSGFTDATKHAVYQRLCSLSIEKVPGFGRRLDPRLRTMGIGTINQFIDTYTSIQNNFNKTVDDIYHELLQIEVVKRTKNAQKSMNRARSFKPTNNRDVLEGQLATNVEFLMRSLRMKQLRTKGISVCLRDTEYHSHKKYIELPYPTQSQHSILSHTLDLFRSLYHRETKYRYVSVMFSQLQSSTWVQQDLFGNHQHDEVDAHLWSYIDAQNSKLGTQAIKVASSLLQPEKLGSHVKTNDSRIILMNKKLPKETSWRRMAYPFLGSIS